MHRLLRSWVVCTGFLYLRWGGAALPCGAQASLWRLLLPQSTGLVVVLRLSCFLACGILPDQGLNPCPLHRTADSWPLDHLGSPFSILKCSYILVTYLCEANTELVEFTKLAEPNKWQYCFSISSAGLCNTCYTHGSFPGLHVEFLRLCLLVWYTLKTGGVNHFFQQHCLIVSGSDFGSFLNTSTFFIIIFATGICQQTLPKVSPMVEHYSTLSHSISS